MIIFAELTIYIFFNFFNKINCMKHFQLIFFLLCSFVAFSQEVITIQGVIKDTSGEPLPGAYVIVKGSQAGVSTDLNGAYLIKVPKGNTLVFKMLGMVSQEKLVNQSSTLNITLQEDLQEIEQVVVTGYQKVDANKVATAYTKIDVQDFQRKAATNVVQGLEGLSSSLVLAANPNSPGSKAFSIRGVSTLSGSSQPLIVVDGFPYQGSIEALNPYQVESITLLKDAASASIYGAKSSNGVIVITTKRGKEGKTQVHYSSQYSFGQKPDLGYALNRVSSSELVDIQYNYVKKLEATDPNRIQSYRYLMENPAYAATLSSSASNYIKTSNRIYYLNALRRFGYLTDADFDSTLNDLRGFDNTKQIEDLYYQSPATNQQNISIMGGNDAFKYNASVNYTQDWGNIKANKDQRVLADFVSNFRISPKASFDFQAHWSSMNNYYRSIDRGITDVPGASISRLGSYERLFDDNGQPLPLSRPSTRDASSNGIFGGKDPYEIERLISLGLLDESYIPAEDFGKNYQESKSWNTRIQGLFNLELADYLTLRFGGQYSKTMGVVQDISLRDSWYMKTLINNTTPTTFTGDTSELNIPLGSRIVQARNETTDYLFRAQIDFNKSFDDHSISALAGTEISSNKIESTETDRFGYDVKSGLFKYDMNYQILQSDIHGVYYPSEDERLIGPITTSEGFSEIENRYFSAYGNLTYGYVQKYFLTGSIRLDQSNLFGTDPKYRYRPFWSLAAKWRLGEEEFFKNKTLSKADFRLSYGINGNIANQSGPFDIAEKSLIYRAGNALGMYITSFKVPNLRWEQTQTINAGVDLGFFDDRLEVSLDYYHKNSTDILSDAEVDPTLGSISILRNDASILNQGYEVSLTSHNIQKENWLWDTQLNFRYNKGKVSKVHFNSDDYFGAYFFAGRTANFEGQEPNSLYVLNYAGLNNQGQGQIKKADGTILTMDEDYEVRNLISFDDLISAGATMPRYVASINNNISYKGFGLSFLLMYQGGHIFMKDSYDGDFIGEDFRLINRDASRAWKTAGDELRTDIPAISSTTSSDLIQGSTKNIRSADFIRLRDVTLSYTLNREFTESIGIRELTFNLKGTNLWLWTKNKEGIDPETQGLGYRTSYLKPTYSVGLNLIF